MNVLLSVYLFIFLNILKQNSPDGKFVIMEVWRRCAQGTSGIHLWLGAFHLCD